ncbi:hypothetical protein ACQP06_11395 [Nocardia sp. CA-136227]|uniref:hypothetical protein n=1 Tax=Nocardia sp. CA-136227 TaxID=3239979 RepID=UPI003D97B2DD
MGFTVQHRRSTAAAIWRRLRTWTLIMLGIALMLGILLAPLVFVLHKLLGLVGEHLS